MFREQDLFKAANMYNMIDKTQHMLQNKIFAQSSINQVKLVKDTQKYRQMLYGGDGEDAMEDDEATEIIGFVPGATNRTYASATMQSALGKTYSTNTGGDKQSNLKLKTINKSLAKLDQISQLNWSKKDLNLDSITVNNQVFNRVQTTVDPRVFRDSGFEHSKYESQLSHSSGLLGLN